MNGNYALVKIDICGSKEYIDKNIASDPDVRTNLTDMLIKFIKRVFPYSDSRYPVGSQYSIEGDAVSLILTKPTVALRATVEFMKEWNSNLSSFPDCRAVIDYGYFKGINRDGNIELQGEAFDNISKIEKEFTSGQIGVTNNFVDRCDQTLVQFTRRVKVQLTTSRHIDTWLVNYDNPRLLHLSNLSHALFIADPASADVRDRAIEAIIIEAIYEQGVKEISYEDLNVAFQKKSCPDPGRIELRRILEKSTYIEESAFEKILLRVGVKDNISKIQEQFINSQDLAVDFIVSRLSERIGVPKDILNDKLNITNLLEEYLCAVYLEIRMMANYFRSTSVLFDRLSAAKEYDYVIMKFLRNVLPDRVEEITFVKREFIEALKELASTNNEYLASIFHNVLMLYYLNRNTNFSQGQLAVIKDKDYILDANAFYAYICSSSDYYDILQYTLNKLVLFGANIYLFDKSLNEYTESIENAQNKFNNITLRSFLTQHQPWIWKEFVKNNARYRNDFDVCINIHMFPKKKLSDAEKRFEAASIELNKHNIKLIKLDPYLEKENIPELYEELYEAKKKYDPDAHWYVIKGSPEKYHSLVLHDSNCLHILQHDTPNPFAASKLFITCDFSLTKLRRKHPNKYEYVITVPEFYEFMLPYLFMDNLMVKQPVQMPNFLLASSLHKELFKTINFKELFGDYIAGNIENIGDFEILSELSSTKRYKSIKEKHEKLADAKLEQMDTEAKEIIKEAADLFLDYSNSIQKSVVKHLAKEALDEKDRHLQKVIISQKESEEKIRVLEEEIHKLKNRSKKKDKYDKMMNNIIKKSKHR